eukprot:gene1425-1997_t
MDAWLAYLTTGQSEYTVVGVDSLWLVIINACCAGIVFYRDEKDKSSKARLRPDSTMFINGAIFAKAEEKGRVEDIGIATDELCRKFDRKARKLFPLGGNAILGITASKDFISTHLIASANGTFSSTPLKNYNLQFINGRAEFVVDLIKFMRYVSGIAGPHEKFHLVPDVRNRTPNGHHVTWTVDGLVKEFHRIERIQM